MSCARNTQVIEMQRICICVLSQAAVDQVWRMLIRADRLLLRLSSHRSYLSALLCRLHLFFYVLDCEILHFLFHLKLFQSGWWLSQWLFSSVHLEENISFLVEMWFTTALA